MLEVLLFSFSISIDAFGYSIGFGTRNIKINKLEFLIINLLNSTILTLLLLTYSKFKHLIENNSLIEKIVPYLLILFGFYYIFSSFVSLFKKHKNKEGVFLKEDNYFKISDILLLFFVFLCENTFSTFVFYTSLNGVELFVLSNFIFHYLFFVIGFDLGNKIIKKISFNSSFLSGVIFVLLGIFNLHG